MESPPRPADLVSAHMAFWREAGVDLAYRDAAGNWLEEPDRPDAHEAKSPAEGKAPTDRNRRRPDTPVQAPPLPDIAAFRGDWPSEREAFDEWWLTETRLALPGASTAVGAFGPAGAPLAIVVPQPLSTDRGGLPETGPSARLVREFLRSAEIEPAEALILPALRAALPVPEWNALAAAGWGALLRHRLELYRPARVIGFGAAIRSLLENEPSHGAGIFAMRALSEGDKPVAIAPSLELMLANPRAKARFWNHWIEWTER